MDLLMHHGQRSLATTAMCAHGPVPVPGREQQADLMERRDRELEDPLAAAHTGDRMTSATEAAAARAKWRFRAETPAMICSISGLLSRRDDEHGGLGGRGHGPQAGG